MRSFLRIDERVWLLWAAWVLLLPLKWIIAAAVASFVHEVCHGAVVVLLGGKIQGLYVKPFGIVMDTDGIFGFREIICALAGPVGSSCLVFFISRFPLLGICALVQGAFNCLPVYPLDGGRVMRSLLEICAPEYAEGICCWVERAVLFLLAGISAYLSVRFALGYFPVFLWLFTVARCLMRKRP